MAFDKPTRNRLASFVAEARDLIADEFTQQFQSLYGISDKGTITPLDHLGHLDDTGLAAADLLRERITYLIKTHPNDREGNKAAVTRLAREQAFTILNRLAAIRMAEKRGLIVESVGKGYQSKGFKVFEQIAGAGLGDIYHRYRRYLFCLFDELAVDLGILFDRRSPQGLLFPRETALRYLFTFLNAADLDPLWAEDETIGWIYQYYNDPAERKKMRDESATPRNSRELAIRNQFFTPRYVVEFLTDNTLGRIWYEMTQDGTKLKDQCCYLVRRPTEIFLKSGETVPATPSQDGVSQEELLKRPVYIPFRPIKDPRELLMLDPACGSMHFGLYAFDLFEVIYEEAWDIGLEPLRQDYPEKDAFMREVPRLIIEHNIHGIDIDPRAVQIAGLSLWLRAQKSWQAQRVPSAQRPRIIRSNIVCAEPMPGSPEMLKEFTATLHPPLLGQMVEKVFAQMQLAGEAGSLLKIEEEIATLVKDAKKLWKTRPKAEQTEFDLGLPEKTKQGELILDLSGISDERFWETAEEKIYAALRTYAEQADSAGYQRRLFAEDAARGFAFIDLCRKRYDIVVMNPPFGELSISIAARIKSRYPESSSNIGCTFVESCLDALNKNGHLGTIIDYATCVRSSYEPFRRKVLYTLGRLETICHSGWGVLDANVETCFYTLRKQRLHHDTVACWQIADHAGKQAENLVAQFKTPRYVDCSLFEAFPNGVPNFSLPLSVTTAFKLGMPLDPTLAKVRTGISTGDNERFYKLSWEHTIDYGWLHLANGGAFSPYYRPAQEVIDWRCEGAPILELRDENGKKLAFPRSLDLVGKPGLCWGKRGNFLSVQVHPAGRFFTNEGQIIIPLNQADAWRILAVVNSRLLRALINEYCGQHKENGYVSLLPIPNIQSNDASVVENAAALSHKALRHICMFRQEHAETIPPCYAGATLREFIFKTMEKIASCEATLNTLAEQIDVILERVFALDADGASWLADKTQHMPKPVYTANVFIWENKEFASEALDWLVGFCFGRWDIRLATGERQPPELPAPFAPLPVCPPGMLQSADGRPAEQKDVPADYALRISWRGILVDDENHPQDIIVRVREALEVIWKDRADVIEQETCELLDVKTLRDYFRRPAGFFADHLKRYSKSRRQAPIYWPLSTAKGSYTLWIYYHRLSDQTLHMALADFVDPKLKTVRSEIGALRESGTHQNHLEELLDLEKELTDFHSEIERIIKLPWKPNLNDGVLITASPLWKLFRLPKWQKDLNACWEKLEKGDYDWARLAYSIWPKRVEEVCKKDRSIAIAHNMEHLCQVAPPKAKGKKGKRKKTIVPEESEQ